MIKLSYVVLMVLGIMLLNCSAEKPEIDRSLINTAHLDRLTETLVLDNVEMAIIHIYADAPSYEWTEAPGEGIACIDDVARAAIFYLRHADYKKDASSLKKAKKLLNFIIYMQAENGRFYNFILDDYRINKTRSNSVPEDNWWTWRALWALAEGYNFFLERDTAFAQKLSISIKKALPAISSGLEKYPDIQKIKGFSQASWLPVGGAADQAAVILLALSALKKHNYSAEIDEWIAKYVNGILEYQVGEANVFPHHIFLTWKNIWHAWGNNQAHSILTVAGQLNQPEWIKRAANEVKYFYPYLMAENYLWQFEVERDGENYKQVKREEFPQIAYGIRPMVWASLAAGNLLDNPDYYIQAAEIAGWLLGKNITGKFLYDPDTGRCFDGINSADELNFNSGAESTIEALLTILEIEQQPLAKKKFFKIYDKQNIE